jgi:hypothetical protein
MQSKLSKDSASSILSQGDWVLYGLMTCTSFAMYRTWSSDPESIKVYDYFTRYMRALLNEVALMGNFPFYARQANQKLTNLHSEGFKIGEAIPPRNMVKKWRVRTVDHQPVSAVAETWSAFAALKVYPESRAKTFAMRLGIERTRTSELAAIQDAIDRSTGEIQCTFIKLSQMGSYYGEIYLSTAGSKLFGNTTVKPPAVNTRLRLGVIGGPHDTKKLAGVVTTDVYGRGRDLCVSVYVLKGSRDFPEASTTVNVDLSFSDDPTSCNRQAAAMVALGDELQRKSGADFQSLLLECPSVIENTGSLANEVKDSAPAKKEWDGALAACRFTPEQSEALNMSFRSKSGVTIVHGPPGTGKTFTQMAGMVAHLCVGNSSSARRRPVLATAPGHVAVDNNMSNFIKLAKQAGKKFQVCRFRGGAPSPYMGQVRSDNAAIKEALFSLQQGGEQLEGAEGEFDSDAYAIWEAIDAQTKGNQRLGAGVIPEYEFNAQRKAFVAKVAKDKTSPDMHQARNLFDAKKALKQAKGDAKDELLQHIDKLDAYFNQRYFDQADIVFVTNNGSAHPLLATHYRPRILASDEVGQASLVDQATPISTFIETLEYFWATGDPMQQGPSPLVQGSNETYYDVSKSPFTMLFENKSIEERIMLLEQHRMRPVISGMVSRLWYESKLRDGESVLSASPLEETILEAYAKLKPFWNGSTRMMVDVSGQNVKSEAFGDQSSLFNQAEADLLLDHIEFLLSFDPPQTGGEPTRRRIAQEDILVLTAYSGQTLYIIRQLWKRKINNVK